MTAFATAATATAPITLTILTVACVASWAADRCVRWADRRGDERDGRGYVERQRTARQKGMTP